MIKEKFIQNKLALIVLISASLIVVVSMGMQTCLWFVCRILR